MLEIKTISNRAKAEFDAEVNAALREGWELVKRECLIVGADHSPVLYAELERIIDEDESCTDIFESATWDITRDPFHPYRCSACGFKAVNITDTCPDCGCTMRIKLD